MSSHSFAPRAAAGQIPLAAAPAVEESSLVSRLWLRSVVRVPGIALAYFVSGWLGLLLAIPPGYATAVWPPSGLALASALYWGWRVWPGIWLGSFLINVFVSVRAPHAQI